MRDIDDINISTQTQKSLYMNHSLIRYNRISKIVRRLIQKLLCGDGQETGRSSLFFLENQFLGLNKKNVTFSRNFSILSMSS
jgi:hypothetical protein